MVNVWTLTAVKPTAGGVVLARFSQSYATLIIMHLHCGRLTAKCGKWVGGGEIKKKKKKGRRKKKKKPVEKVWTPAPESSRRRRRPDQIPPPPLGLTSNVRVSSMALTSKRAVSCQDLTDRKDQELEGLAGSPSSDDIMLRASRQIHRGRSLRCCGGNWVASAGGAVDWERRVADWISVLFSALGRYVSINTYMHTAEVTSLYVTTSGQTTHGWAPCTGQ